MKAVSWPRPQDAFVKIVRNEGLASLWSGLPPTLSVRGKFAFLFLTSCFVLQAAGRWRLLGLEHQSRVKGFPIDSTATDTQFLSTEGRIGCS